MMGHLLSLIEALACCWLIYQVSLLTYRVYLHPLSKVPGPKLAAATRLVNSYHRITGNAENWRHELHERYGDVVRVAPTEVSFATGQAWKEIYGYAPGSKLAKLRKEQEFYRIRMGSIIVADNNRHPRQRKMLANAFSDKAIKQQEPMLRKHIDKLISNLHRISKAGTNTDIVKDYNYATFDIMGDLAWGEPLGCLESSGYTPWVKMVFANVKLGTYVTEIRHYPNMDFLLRRLNPDSLNKDRSKHLKFAKDRVDARIAKQDHDPRPDIWGLILESKDEQPMTRSEMYANSNLLMVAGTETTATLLSGLTYHLLMNPDMMTRLVQEIRSAFTSAADINLKDLAHLSYTNACIDEALRIYPPVPIGLPRTTGPGMTEICGFQIPEKTSVYVHQYSTSHSSRNFHRPDDFLPERWLGSATTDPQSVFAHDDRSAVNAFSIGPRNCIGINLANAEIRLILASVLYNFDLELCEESRHWNQQKVFNLWEKGELRVKIKRASTTKS